MTDIMDDVRSIPTERRYEPPIIGDVPCIVCGERIPINAMQSFYIPRMCRACKQAIMAMRMQAETAKDGEQE